MTILSPMPVPGVADSTLVAPARSHTVTNMPVLILYPHSRCNCRCLMCDIWRGTGRDQIGADEVAAWVSEWRSLGVERVVLSGGEALLHSDLWTLCDVLRGAGIGISILSTGLLLERHAGELVTRCDDVVVSLDGPPDVHDSIRNVPRAFERLAAGVRAVRQLDGGVVVSGRCTIQRRNFRLMRDTVRTAHELTLDRISFLAVDISSSAFNRPDGWSEERAQDVALTHEDVAALDDELDALESEHHADFASGFIAEQPDKLRQRLSAYFKALLGLNAFPANRCNAPWVSTVIEADGTVRPCFFQPALGNVRNAASLSDVLNSPSAIAWREGLDVARNEICQRCVCTLSLEERH